MKRILRASYDRSAAGYDERFWPLQRIKYERMLGAELEPLRGALARGPVLDAGAGTGLLGRFLAERGLGDALCSLVALELSGAMASRARARGHGPVVQGDLERMPFRDGVFAGACAFTSVGLVPGPLAPACRELARVLQPGAPLVITVLERLDRAALQCALEDAGFRCGPPRPCGQDMGWLCVRGAHP